MNTRLLYFLVLPLFISRSMAQELKTVYFDGNNKPCAADTATTKRTGTKINDKWFVMERYVKRDVPFAEGYYADDNLTIADGPFIYYSDYKQKMVSEKGSFKNGKKEGAWKGTYPDNSPSYTAFYENDHIKGIKVSWYPGGEISDSTVIDDKGNGYEKGYWKDGTPSQYGLFVAWEKEGDWTWYHHNGRPSAIDKMKEGKRLSTTCFDENGKPSTQYCGLEVESGFPGGLSAWQAYIRKKTAKATWPPAYFDGKVYGTVVIEFVIDENGHVTEPQVTQHVSPEFDQIALEIVQSSPKWNPAWQDNRRLKSWKKQPFTFPKYRGR